jgi:hypothetical protein
MSRTDRAAVIVATFDKDGHRMVGVRRYRATEAKTCEHDITQLVKVGRQITVTFTEPVDDCAMDVLDDVTRQRITAAATPKRKVKR